MCVPANEMCDLHSVQYSVVVFVVFTSSSFRCCVLFFMTRVTVSLCLIVCSCAGGLGGVRACLVWRSVRCNSVYGFNDVRASARTHSNTEFCPCESVLAKVPMVKLLARHHQELGDVFVCVCDENGACCCMHDHIYINTCIQSLLHVELLLVLRARAIT